MVDPEPVGGVSTRVGGFTIGRGPGVDLPIEDEYASPVHAELYADAAGQAWVNDLGSINGTWLNGVRVRVPTRVHLGDEVRVGRTRYVIPWHELPARRP